MAYFIPADTPLNPTEAWPTAAPAASSHIPGAMRLTASAAPSPSRNSATAPTIGQRLGAGTK